MSWSSPSTQPSHLRPRDIVCLSAVRLFQHLSSSFCLSIMSRHRGRACSKRRPASGERPRLHPRLSCPHRTGSLDVMWLGFLCQPGPPRTRMRRWRPSWRQPSLDALPKGGFVHPGCVLTRQPSPRFNLTALSAAPGEQSLADMTLMMPSPPDVLNANVKPVA